MRIKEGTTTVGAGAFRECTGLVDMIFDSGVTSLGGSAFAGCTLLSVIIFHGYIPSIADNCFDGVDASVYHRCKDRIWLDHMESYGGWFTWYGHIFTAPSSYSDWKPATCTYDTLGV